MARVHGTGSGVSVGKRPTTEDATDSRCRFHPRRKAVAWTHKGPLCRQCFADEDAFHTGMGNPGWYVDPNPLPITDYERKIIERIERTYLRDVYGVEFDGEVSG